MAKKIVKQDYNKMFEKFSRVIAEDPVLSKDVLLFQQMTDFNRMAEMNDNLWADIKENGYMSTNPRTGAPIVNPAVAAFNKNASMLLKAAQWIQEKTKGISLDGEEKGW